VCHYPDQAAHYHILGLKLGASFLTRHSADYSVGRFLSILTLHGKVCPSRVYISCFKVTEYATSRRLSSWTSLVRALWFTRSACCSSVSFRLLYGTSIRMRPCVGPPTTSETSERISAPDMYILPIYITKPMCELLASVLNTNNNSLAPRRLAQP
jgi:hypothetical protein